MSKKLFWLLAALCLVAGSIGYLIKAYVGNVQQKPPTELRANLSGYQYINPLILIYTSKDLYSDEFTDLNRQITSYIQEAKDSGQASQISVYFRDLNDSHWTGIGEDDLYRPASMLKVLTLTAATKLAEDGSIAMTQMLPYQQSASNPEYYSTNSLSSGQHTVQELLIDMIANSNNDAVASLLSNPAIHDEFNTLYKVFKLPSTKSSTDDFMSPRSYSVIWRALYNASLLSDNASNQILTLLTHTSFTSGLVAGVPQGTVVAHKYGELTVLNPDHTLVFRELHDCGIIYYPMKPYLICVMTRGSDFTALAKTISNMSRIIYDFVASKSLVNNAQEEK